MGNLREWIMPDGYSIKSLSTAGTPTFQKRILRKNGKTRAGDPRTDYWTVTVQQVWDSWEIRVTHYGEVEMSLDGYVDPCSAAVAAELHIYEALNLK